jgi:hypothetical protein
MRGKGLLAQVRRSVLHPTAILRPGHTRTVLIGTALGSAAVGISTKKPRCRIVSFALALLSTRDSTQFLPTVHSSLRTAACYTGFRSPPAKRWQIAKDRRADGTPRSLTRSAATNRTAKGHFRSLHSNFRGWEKARGNMFGRQPESGIPPKNSLRPTMQVVVTLLLLLPCLLVILSNRYDPNSKHWAFGTVGTILGFWLKGGR